MDMDCLRRLVVAAETIGSAFVRIADAMEKSPGVTFSLSGPSPDDGMRIRDALEQAAKTYGEAK